MSEQGPISGPEESEEFNTPYAYDVLDEALSIVLAEQVRIDAGCDEDYMPLLPTDGIDTQEGQVESVVADEQTPSPETTTQPPQKHGLAAYALALLAGRTANTVVNAIDGKGKSPHRRTPTA